MRRLRQNPTYRNVNGRDDRGTILIIISVLIIALFGFVTLAINERHYIIVEAQLRLVAEGVAQTGARTTCPTQQCWDDTRTTALAFLNAQILEAEMGKDVSISIPDFAGSTYSTGRLEVTLQRGMWTSRDGFTSLEDDGSFSHPGVPRNLVVNAFRVEIAFDKVSTFLNPFGNVAKNFSVDALAIAREVNPVCAAPFAIPICALTANEQDY